MCGSFFFQAEDGIRDRVRSRGLGDVYKRQGLEIFVFGSVLVLFVLFEPKGLYGRWLKLKGLIEYFPLYRKDTYRRVKSYMRSERYR